MNGIESKAKRPQGAQAKQHRRIGLGAGNDIGGNSP